MTPFGPSRPLQKVSELGFAFGVVRSLIAFPEKTFDIVFFIWASQIPRVFATECFLSNWRYFWFVRVSGRLKIMGFVG